MAIEQELTTGPLGPPPSDPVEAAAPRTKADRALAVLRGMDIHRAPSGLVLLDGEKVVAIPSSEFTEAVQTEWCDVYADETLALSTISRALAAIRADRTLPVTDRVPPPKVRPGARRDVYDDRPTIVIGPDLECNANDGTAALARDPRTFQRAHELVHVTNATTVDASPTSRAPAAHGSPIIHTMALPTLTERLATNAIWVKLNADGEERCVLPSSAVVAAIHARAEWSGIRRLVGIAESPTMRPDGTLVQEPGHDAATGYLYVPNASFPVVPERPTLKDAKAALALLEDVWCDFPFVDAAARMVPVATTLTVLVRPAIKGATPAFVYDASTRGTGKDLSAACAVEIATGRTPPLATFPHGRDGQAELEKMLGAYALSGAPVVYFGNVPIGVPFGGAPLEKVLTAPETVSLRRLGQSEAPELPWNAVVIASGNNLTIADETSRRVLSGRMVCDHERPEERAGWKHRLPEYVRANRPRLVAAALTIVRGYVAAGYPDTGTMALGSFEAWSQLIPRAIVWAGGADVMGARVTVTGDNDEATTTLVTILGHLPGLLKDQDGGLTANAILDALYPGPKPNEPPDGWEDLRRAIESATAARTGTRPDTARLGTYLRGHRDRKVEGKTLVVLGTHARANRWGVR